MGPDCGDGGTFELVLEPRTDRFDIEDERWLKQVSMLYGDLHRDVGEITRLRMPVKGTKGSVEAVILALGSTGAFTAGLEMLRSWLGRDRTRRLEISYTVDGRTESVLIAGDDIDKDGITRLSDAVARRLGEAPWTDTAPS